jgi:hypothetical protein
LVRATLEAAIQKYGQFSTCSGLGFSNEVGIEKVLKGLLLASELGPFTRELVKELGKHPQLVLTDFGNEEFRELYECEKFAYQIWRCGATLRTIGKGAPLIVDPSSPLGFYDDRSDELDKLLRNYDERERTLGASATGTVYPQDLSELRGSGFILVPAYNVAGVYARELNLVFKVLGLTLVDDFKPNFIWVPLNLKGYYLAHTPFADAFERYHRLRLDCVVAVMGALCWRVAYVWQTNKFRTLHYWQRSYEGPTKKDLIIQEIYSFLPISIQMLELGLNPKEVDVAAVVRFLELRQEKQNGIDLLLGGPHWMFLPYGDDRVFVDYAWIPQFLYNLFYGVELSDQNFKGEALEKLVRSGASVLPAGPCRALNGQSKQIDAAFDLGETLVIAECRAVGRSFGVDRGDPRAIAFRLERVDQTLRDVDEKAHWLAANPRGNNYDIRRFRRILPIGVSPFVELIGSTNPRYWIIEGFPRVLTPSELKEVLNSSKLKLAASESSNTVVVSPLR